MWHNATLSSGADETEVKCKDPSSALFEGMMRSCVVNGYSPDAFNSRLPFKCHPNDD